MTEQDFWGMDKSLVDEQWEIKAIEEGENIAENGNIMPEDKEAWYCMEYWRLNYLGLALTCTISLHCWRVSGVSNKDRAMKVQAQSKVNYICRLCLYDSNLHAFSLRQTWFWVQTLELFCDLEQFSRSLRPHVFIIKWKF